MFANGLCMESKNPIALRVLIVQKINYIKMSEFKTVTDVRV